MNLREKYDSQNQFDVLINTFSQIEYAWGNSIDLSNIEPSKIKNIIITGLGGSAIGGDLLQNYLRDELEIPLFINRNYHLPGFADKSSLVIASSYSGNTEETLSAARHAIELDSQIVTVSTGGELEKFASENNLPFVRLLKGFQPRYALCINFFTLLKILQLLNFVKNQDTIVDSIKGIIKSKGIEYGREGNEAEKTAFELLGFIPIIYSVADFTSAVGSRLKGQFNENSKIHAFQNVLPEFNHNEIIGWQSQNENKLRVKVIFINDEDYHRRIKDRIKITSELIRDSGTEIINFSSGFSNYKERLLDLIYFGDWVSYYLALLRKEDPTEIKYINYLKDKLAEISS